MYNKVDKFIKQNQLYHDKIISLIYIILLNMKLTEKQKDALMILKEDESISKENCKIHNNIMNALYFKGLVQLSRYANGEFWEMTDVGLDAVS